MTTIFISITFIRNAEIKLFNLVFEKENINQRTAKNVWTMDTPSMAHFFHLPIISEEIILR